MMNFKPLFESEHVMLTPIDVEKDAPVEAPWTLDPAYASILVAGVRPVTVPGLKKLYKDIRKQADEKRDLVHFMLRQKPDGRLMGFLRFEDLYWPHQSGVIALRFGSEADFAAYAAETLRLGMRYAFDELNLYHLRAVMLDDEAEQIDLHEAAGFTLEVRSRQCIYRHGRYHDKLVYAMRQPQWAARREEKQG